MEFQGLPSLAELELSRPLQPLATTRTLQDQSKTGLLPLKPHPCSSDPGATRLAFPGAPKRDTTTRRPTGAKKKVVLFVPGRAQILLANPQPSCPGLKRYLLARHSGQAQPEFPSSFQTAQAPGRHAQKSHWREAGRWHRVASPDNSTKRKMAASSTDAKNHTAQGPRGDQLSLHSPGHSQATWPGPCLSLWSRLPQPQSPGPTLPRLHLLPHFPQLQGAGGGRHRCSWRLGQTPCPSRHQGAFHPKLGRNDSGSARSSLKNISLAPLPLHLSPSPSSAQCRSPEFFPYFPLG